MTEMVAAVRAHALAHYNEAGWDYVVECWSDADIEFEIRQSDGTLEGAIHNIGSQVAVQDEIRRDVQSEAF
jgi:hypothetical protein